MDEVKNIQFTDVFNIEDIQRILDLFSKTTGVASIITQPDGTPITQPVNYCRLCNNLIRNSEKGRAYCCQPNATFGQSHSSGLVIQPCPSVGLWNAGANIIVGGKHIANWLIGQVRNEALDEQHMIAYANEIGVNQEEFKQALKEVPVMSFEQFSNAANMLFAFVNELSEKANNNLHLKTQIEEQIKTTKALQQSEERYRTLFEQSNDALFLEDISTGKYLDANRAGEIKTGKSLDDLKKLKTYEITPKGATKKIERLTDENNPLEMGEVEHLRPDGTIRTALLNTVPLSRGPVFDIAHDITEQKNIEESLKSSFSLTEAILESIHNGILVVNHNGHVIKTNAKFAQMWRIPSDILASQDDKTLMDYILEQLTDPEDFIVKVSELYGNSEAETLDLLSFKDGRIFERISKPMYLGGQPKGRVWSFLDITQNRRIEQELVTAKEHAEESDRLKSAFLANMSHEIRTPMNGILGFADLLKEQDLSEEEQGEYISIIKKSSSRMLNIINDLVDISKVESGQMEISLSETNINHQIEYIYSFLKTEAERKGLKITFQNSLSDSEAIIKTDREKVYAILANLVKNAIKYSDTGSIEFGYNLKPDSAPLELAFYVKDTGIGIPQNKKEAIFDRFIQADATDQRAFQGAGLGLAISKAYVEMLGGKIWVDSELGRGSTFHFSLPYTGKQRVKPVAQNMISAEACVNQIKNLKILIAEDDELSDMLLTKIISIFAKEVLKVRTGVEAVQACFQNPDIQLILMDIKMPELNGYEATRQIRQFNKEVIIIAQTAYALKGDREMAIEAGCNDYIPKPVNKTLLRELIKKYFC